MRSGICWRPGDFMRTPFLGVKAFQTQKGSLARCHSPSVPTWFSHRRWHGERLTDRDFRWNRIVDFRRHGFWRRGRRHLGHLRGHRRIWRIRVQMLRHKKTTDGGLDHFHVCPFVRLVPGMRDFKSPLTSTVAGSGRFVLPAVLWQLACQADQMRRFDDLQQQALSFAHSGRVLSRYESRGTSPTRNFFCQAPSRML